MPKKAYARIWKKTCVLSLSDRRWFFGSKTVCARQVRKFSMAQKNERKVKKMKNRILSLLLALVMVVCMISILASCKDPDNTGDGGNEDDDVVTEKNYPWTKTDIFFMLSENDNNKELSSGAKRYLAGKSTDNETIDIAIDERNANAEKECKVTVKYDYMGGEGNTDDENFQWGRNIDYIDGLVKSGAPTAPDMYSTFVYDMVGALLRGSFRNILNNENGDNYFRFLEEDYDYDYLHIELSDEDANDEGFMFEYMTSLTLSSRKMYLVASDYFTDLVRAFFVVPVNIKLLTENATAVTGNADGIGETGDYNDLIYLVRNQKWNYELLKRYCDAVVAENQDGVVDLEGTVGFAVASGSGLSSSGLLYTTPITIINRVGSSVTDYKYSYPKKNPQLTDYCNKLATLMQSEGAYVHADLNTIRSAFSNNHVLFGGVICVGSLEDPAYQRMRDYKGFGVVPVPLFAETYINKDGEEEAVKYLTQIHNIGRIGGISAASQKFSQCTAFLSYVSTHSTDILNEYYEWKLSVSTVGGTGAADANAEMLEYIRSNVRSSFDKVFEDALGLYGNFGENLYHKIIQNGGAEGDEFANVQTAPFQIGENITGIYQGLLSTRETALTALIDAFERGSFGK